MPDSGGHLPKSPHRRDQDHYGRSLRVVTRGGRSLGDQLVAEGLAEPWLGRRSDWSVLLGQAG